MSASVGKLVIRLVAITDDFEPGMGRAQALIAKFSRLLNVLRRDLTQVREGLSTMWQSIGAMGGHTNVLVQGLVLLGVAWLRFMGLAQNGGAFTPAILTLERAIIDCLGFGVSTFGALGKSGALAMAAINPMQVVYQFRQLLGITSKIAGMMFFPALLTMHFKLGLVLLTMRFLFMNLGDALDKSASSLMAFSDKWRIFWTKLAVRTAPGMPIQSTSGATALAGAISTMKSAKILLQAAFSSMWSGLIGAGEGLAQVLGGVFHAAWSASKLAAEGVMALAASLMTLGAIIVVMAGTAFWHWIRASIDSASATAQAAKKLDISVESMVMFEEAARRLGIQGNKLTSWLNTLSRQMGEFGRGGKTATKMFAVMGVDMNKFTMKPLDEQFLAVAEHIRALPTAAERAIAAFKVFGRSGVDILPMLELGEARLRAIGQEAKLTGQSFTPESAVQAIQAKMAMTELLGVLRGLGIQLAIQFAPVVQAIAEGFLTWAREGGEVREIAASIFACLVNTLAIVIDVVEAFSFWFRVLRTAFSAMVSFLSTAVAKVSKLNQISMTLMGLPLASKWGELADSAEKAAKWAEEMGQKDIDWIGEKSANGTAGDKFIDWVRKTRARADELAAVAVKAAEAQKRLGMPLRDLEALFEEFEKGDKLELELRNPFEKMQDSLEEFNNLLVDGAILGETFGRAVGKAFHDAASGLHVGQSRLAAAMRIDSREAASAIIQNSVAVASPEERVEKLLVEANAVAKQTRDYNKALLEAMKAKRLLWP